MKIFGVIAAAFLLAACGQKESASPANPAPAAEASDVGAEAAPTDNDASAMAEIPPPPPSRVNEVDWPDTATRAKIVTSKGDIVVELYPDKAPKTVANFLQYAKDGHYDQLIFHRVVPGFVIQGGGYNKYYAERPTRDPVPYEGDNGLGNYRTTLAMARTMDPNSASAQWYVNLKDNNDILDHFVNDLGPRYGYAVFGRVIEGMDIVDAIGAIPTGPGGPFPAEAPKTTVSIIRVDTIE